MQSFIFKSLSSEIIKLCEDYHILTEIDFVMQFSKITMPDFAAEAEIYQTELFSKPKLG